MKITICIGSSCHLKGSRLIVEELEGGKVTEARFKELLATWSDDATKEKKQYADGFYFCKYTNYVDKEIVKAAMELEVGDFAVVETEEYGYHIIFRCDLKDGAWKNSDQAQWFESFAYDAYYETYLEILDEVLADKPAEWDKDYTDSLKLADIYCKEIFYDKD